MNKSYFDSWYRVRADSCSIENCLLYRSFISDTYKVDKHLRLFRDNRKYFRKLFGVPDTHWRSLGFYYHVWIREFKGEKFILLSAIGKGTCIEICDTSIKDIDKKSEVIMSFIEDLLSKLPVR